VLEVNKECNNKEDRQDADILGRAIILAGKLTKKQLRSIIIELVISFK
jgi:hypothetical protein